MSSVVPPEQCRARPQVVFLFLSPFTLNHPVVFLFSWHFTSPLIALSVSFSTPPLCQCFPSLRLRNLPSPPFRPTLPRWEIFLHFHPLLVVVAVVVVVLVLSVLTDSVNQCQSVLSHSFSLPGKIHSHSLLVTLILKSWFIALACFDYFFYSCLKIYRRFININYLDNQIKVGDLTLEIVINLHNLPLKSCFQNLYLWNLKHFFR